MIKIQTDIDEKSQKSLSKTAQIINIILIVVGIIGLLLYVVLSTIFENSYLDILLVFAIPFGIGIVYYILINKNIKRWLKINLLMRILLKTIF